jgi:hypothetical protein
MADVLVDDRTRDETSFEAVIARCGVVMDAVRRLGGGIPCCDPVPRGRRLQFSHAPPNYVLLTPTRWLPDARMPPRMVNKTA